MLFRRHVFEICRLERHINQKKQTYVSIILRLWTNRDDMSKQWTDSQKMYKSVPLLNTLSLVSVVRQQFPHMNALIQVVLEFNGYV